MSILLSIKPEYSEKILSGEKKFEFRRQKPKFPTSKAFIYESHPSKLIVGYFNVLKILSGTPEEIWNKCKHSGGIERNKYFAYCQGKSIIYAFQIGGTHRFVTPINPYEIDSSFKPPQNFNYFNDSFAIQSMKEEMA